MVNRRKPETKNTETARGTLSATLRAAIWQAHNRKCAYTGQAVDLMDLEIDHIIPVTISSDDLRKLKTEDVIPADFDLNGLGNLLPTTRFQNRRKQANLRSKSALLHFLAVAEQYRSAADAFIRATSDQSRLLNAYLKLKAQAERNDLAVEDIVDIHRQQADGFSRLRLSPELQGITNLTHLNSELAKELMTKPFALGGGHITEVVLQNDAGEKTVCSDCLSFLAAKDNGLWPKSQFDINCFGMADRNCELLRRLGNARFAPASLIRYPRITCKELDHWSSRWVQRGWTSYFEAEGDEELFERCPSIADLVSAGACRVEELTEWRFRVEPAKGLGIVVNELFRADLDGDGAEEILVFDVIYAPEGTLRSPSVSIARPCANGLIYPEHLGSVAAK